MNAIPMRTKDNNVRAMRPPGAPTSLLSDSRYDLYKEEYFKELILMEAKRSQRTSNLFMLMSLEIDDSIQGTSRDDLLSKIIFTLAATTRSIDVKGWYQDDSVIGVIFPEIRRVDRDVVKDKIFEKIYRKLTSLLDLDQMSSVVVLFRFPSEGEGGRVTYDTLQCNEPPLNLKSFACAEASQGPVPTNGTPVHGAPDQKMESISHEGITLGVAGRAWFLTIGDVLLIGLAAWVGLWLRHGLQAASSPTYANPYLLGYLFVPASLYVFDMYNTGRSFFSSDSAVRGSVATLLGAFVAAVLLHVHLPGRFGVETLLLQIGLIWICVSLWRLLYGTFCHAAAPKVRTLILGTGEKAEALCRLLNNPLSPYEVRGYLDISPARKGTILGSTAILGSIDRLSEVAREIWARTVILTTSMSNHPELARTILEARLQGIEVLDMPAVYEKLTGRVPVKYLEDEWLLFADGFYLLSKEWVQRLKRVTDVLFCGVLLLLSAPISMVAAVAIRLDSSGPVLYRQERVGKGGRVFTILKFRSMHQNAEANGAQWAQKKDPRVTRVGHWLRLTRIDELPQLWNVLRGDMSLVGPRPERPEFISELETRIPYYAARHSVAPGITGWAQVNYRYGSSVQDALHKLEYDLYYIKNMSLLLDFQILLRTIGVAILGDGAR